MHPRVGELGAGSIMLEKAALKAAPAPARRSAQRGLEVAQAAVAAKAVGTSRGSAAAVAGISSLRGLHEQGWIPTGVASRRRAACLTFIVLVALRLCSLIMCKIV